jgi:hypothetical protein
LHPELKNSKSNKDKNKSNKNDNKFKDESTKTVISALAYNSGDLSLEKNNKEGYITLELILDSGASEHYIYNRDWFLNYNKISNKSIKTTSGHALLVISQGDIPIKITNNSSYTNMIIKGVFYVPGLKLL